MDLDEPRGAGRHPRRAASPPPRQPWPRRAEREQNQHGQNQAGGREPRPVPPATRRPEPAAPPPWPRRSERTGAPQNLAREGERRPPEHRRPADRPADAGGPPRRPVPPRDDRPGEAPARPGTARKAPAPGAPNPAHRGAASRNPGGRDGRGGETPVGEAVVRETPRRDTPVHETPRRDRPVRETPRRDTPLRETFRGDAPAPDTAARSMPTTPAPARDTSAPGTGRPRDARSRQAPPPPEADDAANEQTQPVTKARRLADAERTEDAGQAGRRTASRTPPPGRRRRPAAGGASRRRRLGPALAATAAATALPGLGHLILRRRRTGGLILGAFLAGVGVLVVALLTMGRSDLLQTVLSTRFLGVAAVVSLLAAIAWIAVIIRTYLLAKPTRMDTGRKLLGAGVVTALCLVVAVPFGFTAELANSQRNLLNTLFRGGGTSAADAINQPRLNVLLLGSDAGPDRTGTRTDTMMVASIDTRTSKTLLFSLPRNIQRAQFPPGSPMAKKFQDGFHDPNDPLSGNYLLNAVYAYAHENPAVAPSGPTPDPGINLLGSSISYMLGLPLDYYLEVNMAGFSSIIDAVGGVSVDVGPVPIPIDGVTADGRHVKPSGYIQPGRQQLNGEEALWFARSRRDSTDYDRMGRQRCLIQAVLDQKSPADLLTNFQSVAAAATDNITTNIPQDILPKLVSLAGEGGALHLQSVAFDPSLPDPNQPDGQFNTARPDPAYMRSVVSAAIEGKPLVTTPATPTTTPRATSRRAAGPTTSPSAAPTTPTAPTTPAAPTSLADSCASQTP